MRNKFYIDFNGEVQPGDHFTIQPHKCLRPGEVWAAYRGIVTNVLYNGRGVEVEACVELPDRQQIVSIQPGYAKYFARRMGGHLD